MSEDNAFRVGGCSGGVSDCGIIIVGKRLSDCQKLFQRMRTEVFLPHFYYFREGNFFFLIFFLVVEDDDLPEQRQFIDDRTYFLQLVAGYHNIFYIGMCQTEQQVVCLFQFDREGDVGGSGVEHRQFADDPGVAAFAEQGHVVAFHYSQGNQSGAQRVNLFPYLCVGGRLKFVCCLFP